MDIHPDWTWGLIKAGQSHAYAGNCTKAVELSNKADEKINGWGSARMQAWLARNYYLCGEEEFYKRAFDRIMKGINEGIIEDPFAVAELYTAVENHEKIIDWLEIS